MNHYTQADWAAYIKDELQEEQRQKYEDHLYSCDHCLETYMSCVQEHAALLHVPTSLQKEQWAEERPVQKIGYPSRKRFVPYVIAASITLILTGTGVFESLISYPVTDSPVSYSEKAVQTVTGWLDHIKK